MGASMRLARHGLRTVQALDLITESSLHLARWPIAECFGHQGSRSVGPAFGPIPGGHIRPSGAPSILSDDLAVNALEFEPGEVEAAHHRPLRNLQDLRNLGVG